MEHWTSIICLTLGAAMAILRSWVAVRNGSRHAFVFYPKAKQLVAEHSSGTADGVPRW
jgi:hypothetical protein